MSSPSIAVRIPASRPRGIRRVTAPLFIAMLAFACAQLAAPSVMQVLVAH